MIPTKINKSVTNKILSVTADIKILVHQNNKNLTITIHNNKSPQNIKKKIFKVM